MEILKQILPEETNIKETEQEYRVRLILRYIETKIIRSNESSSDEEEKKIKKYYLLMDPHKKADALYEKVMAYMADKQAEKEMKREAKSAGDNLALEKPDPYLISEIKILSNDEDVKKLLPETYGEARIDAKKFQVSELGNLWKGINEEITEKKEIYKQLEQKIYLNKIFGKGKISSAKSRMAWLATNITFLEKRKSNLETLQGFPKTVENTDSVAYFQYDNLKKYKKQLDKGFVWLPSREKIHQETISAILNHRWPVLIGEAGSGKSDQADAAAIELTGYLPTNVACSPKTGEKDLVKDLAVDPKTGGSYEVYGPLMRALTGYEDSRQTEPSYKTGRITRFDEAYRIPNDSSGYSIIKEARQLKPGDLFYGKPVLPGSSAIWTTNPPGPRYPNRYSPDVALRRELAENFVDYPEMSNEEPELYEFALTALFDENNHIAAAKKELAPEYEKKEIPEDQREILEDGSIVVAKDEIIKNMTDANHGALWRFCGAIKSLQESFVYGNTETEKYPETVLRYKQDTDDNIEITTDGNGEPLTLSTSTVTLGELASWMSGFNERKQKQNEEFRVNTLTEWLDFKINTYLKQADKADKEKIKAIFKHFHFLENRAPDISHAKPLTPKEIGYLSPRVPRPVYIEKPQTERDEEKKTGVPDGEAKKYETKQVLLEDGARILIKENEFNIGEGKSAILIHIGDRFIHEKELFVFAGVVEDEASEYNSKPIGQLASGEKLYKVFNPEELNLGILNEFKNSIQETETDNFGINNFKQSFIDYLKEEGCEEACV
ncbi:MAG: AAA family ATPase [bacterium]